MTLSTQIVHWPGKDTFVCDKHAVQMRKVAVAMGFSVSSTIAIDYKIPCENCSNEEDLEPVSSIAERVFPEVIAEIQHHPAAHLDSDRTIGKSLWHQECDESSLLNRRG